eukprot:COSAG06_NODE_166_length_21548_cov_13.568651_9_plen_168_part_00
MAVCGSYLHRGAVLQEAHQLPSQSQPDHTEQRSAAINTDIAVGADAAHEQGQSGSAVLESVRSRGRLRGSLLTASKGARELGGAGSRRSYCQAKGGGGSRPRVRTQRRRQRRGSGSDGETMVTVLDLVGSLLHPPHFISSALYESPSLEHSRRAQLAQLTLKLLDDG